MSLDPPGHRRLDAEGPPAGSEPSHARPLLAQWNFSALLWGQLISILGERFTYIALVGLVAQHTLNFSDPRSSWLLSLLANVMLAPVLLFAPFTGAWVDRLNLKRVLVVSDTLRALLIVLVPLLYPLWHHMLPVFVIVFALFTANVFFLPAKSAITPEIVPPAQLLAANALLTFAGIVATAVGVPLGGWVVDHWGWPLALSINAVTYLVSVGALALIRYRPEMHEAHATEISVRNYVHEVGEGWALVRSSRPVGVALMALGALWLGGGFLHVAGNQHIQRAASIPGMLRVGVLVAVLGLGAALCTWWVNHRGKRVKGHVLLAAGLVLVGGGLVAFAVSARFAVFAGAALIVGIGAAPGFVLSETLLQTGTSARQRGRVFSARDFLMRLLFLISVTAAAWVTDAYGTRDAILVAAVLSVAAGVAVFVYGSRGAAATLTRPPAG
jgi:MFS family permease